MRLAHLAAVLVFAIALPAFASDDPVDAIVPADTTPPDVRAPSTAAIGLVGNWGLAGWPMIAGLGLAAIAAGAATGRRPRNEGTGSGGPLDAGAAASDPATGSFPADPPSAESAPSEPAMPGDDTRAYLALHHVDLAVAVLRRHVDGEEPSMPAAWLMLLELYRTHGRESAFQELAVQFHARFNVQTPDWQRFPHDGEPGLEAFPRLLKEITACWGTHECRRIIARLLYDNRGGRRTGFSLRAYRDLVTLERLSASVLESIEADLREEATLRHAFEAAAAGASGVDSANVVALRRPERKAEDTADGVALHQELESQLEADLRQRMDEQSVLERENPALAEMLAREWRDPVLAARLCELLARGIGDSHRLSTDAAEEIEVLRRIALAEAAEGLPVTEERG